MNIIYIVTPCLNAKDTIDQTIASVLSQAGNFAIRYHVQDGGSDDGTVSRLQYWQDILKRGNVPIQCRDVAFSYASARDEGMYHALVEGFASMQIHRHAFMSWINADDFFLPGAFSFIDNIARSFPAKYVSWVGGNKLIFEDSFPSITFENLMPTNLIKEGLCDGKCWNFVQQEGIFFRRWLWSVCEASKELLEYKYAGDWHLWRLFALHAKMTNAHLPLAAFRKHSGQVSQKMGDYYTTELHRAIPPDERTSRFKQIIESERLRARLLKPHSRATNTGFDLVERGTDGLAHFHYHKLFNAYPPYPLDKQKDRAAKLIYSPQ